MDSNKLQVELETNTQSVITPSQTISSTVHPPQPTLKRKMHKALRKTKNLFLFSKKK